MMVKGDDGLMDGGKFGWEDDGWGRRRMDCGEDTPNVNFFSGGLVRNHQPDARRRRDWSPVLRMGKLSVVWVFVCLTFVWWVCSG